MRGPGLFILLSLQEFLSDLVGLVLIPLLILLRNPTMKMFAKHWIASTILGAKLEIVSEIWSKLQEKIGKNKALINQVSPSDTEKQISYLEIIIH